MGCAQSRSTAKTKSRIVVHDLDIQEHCSSINRVPGNLGEPRWVALPKYGRSATYIAPAEACSSALLLTSTMNTSGLPEFNGLGLLSLLRVPPVIIDDLLEEIVSHEFNEAIRGHHGNVYPTCNVGAAFKRRQLLKKMSLRRMLSTRAPKILA